MPGRYDRLTVNAASERTIELIVEFRKLVGHRGINPTLMSLIAEYVAKKKQEGRK